MGMLCVEDEDHPKIINTKAKSATNGKHAHKGFLSCFGFTYDATTPGSRKHKQIDLYNKRSLVNDGVGATIKIVPPTQKTR